MKIRLTIMTENDKHIDERISDERVEQMVAMAWQMILDNLPGKSLDEKGIVEKCELVER